MAEAIHDLVPRPPVDALPLVPARARVVETRESFRGVLIFRGEANGEQNQGNNGVQIQIRLDAYGRRAEGLTEQMSLTLDKRTGNLFRRDHRYEILIRDVTDEERDDLS